MIRNELGTMPLVRPECWGDRFFVFPADHPAAYRERTSMPPVYASPPSGRIR